MVGGRILLLLMKERDSKHKRKRMGGIDADNGRIRLQIDRVSNPFVKKCEKKMRASSKL